MTYSQRKEELLKKQIIPQTMEDDFEEFWNREIQNLRSIPLKVERELMDLPYKTFSAYKIQYNTHDETVVTAYLCVPNTYCGKPLSAEYTACLQKRLNKALRLLFCRRAVPW